MANLWASRWTRWGIALGFALGGFFDGILLHQILQWHHLLSLVRGIDDLRMQVLFDGYFHALMYLIAIAGLWGLWRARGAPGAEWGSTLAGAALVGFGAWHVVDGVLSHWILGIHRIRIDSGRPLFWDLLWFVVFGLAPIFGGSRLVRAGAARLRNPGSTLLALVLATSGAGAWALQPPPGQPYTTVVFAPGKQPNDVFAALDAANARLLWADRRMGVVVVAVTPHDRWRFYAHGALLVSGDTGTGGCFNWARP